MNTISYPAFKLFAKRIMQKLFYLWNKSDTSEMSAKNRYHANP